MDIRVEVDGNIIIMKLSGSLVASTVDDIRSQVQKLITKKYPFIIFDLAGVDFVDSSGLGICIATSRELSASSGRLVCSGLRDNARKLFSITRADQKITVVPTRTDALAFMQDLLCDNSSARSPYL